MEKKSTYDEKWVQAWEGRFTYLPCFPFRFAFLPHSHFNKVEVQERIVAVEIPNEG